MWIVLSSFFLELSPSRPTLALPLSVMYLEKYASTFLQNHYEVQRFCGTEHCWRLGLGAPFYLAHIGTR